MTWLRSLLLIPHVVSSLKLIDELEILKKSRRSVKPKTLDRLLKKAGFVRRMGKGDHWVYKHPERQLILTVDPRNPLLPAYVGKAIRAMEEILENE